MVTSPELECDQGVRCEMVSNNSSTGLSPGGGVSSDESDSYASPLQAAVLVGVLIIVCAFSFIDLQLLALMADPIKRALSLSDTALGSLQGAATYLSMCIGMFIVGPQIDKRDRLTMLGWAGMGWSVFTALSAVSTGFWSLFICRACVGFSEAALFPVTYSLITDLYRPAARPTAFLGYFAVANVVDGLSLYLVGILIGRLDNGSPLLRLAPWREAFLVLSVPGFAVSAMLLLMREPSRHSSDKENVIDRSESIRHYLAKNGAVFWALSGCMFFALIGWYAYMFWMPTLLGRITGLIPAVAGKRFGLLISTGPIVGVILAGLTMRYLRPRLGHSTQLRIFQSGIVGTAALLPWMLMAKTENALLVHWLTCCIFVYFAVPLAPNILSHVAPAHIRGRLFAFYQLAITLPGVVGPPAVGSLSDSIFTGPRGLLLALAAVCIGCSVIAPLLAIYLGRQLARR
jgi:MFS family permease